MKSCRCNPVQEPFEFPIIEKNINLKLCVEDYSEPCDLCELKEKIICDFQSIIRKLECGIQPDLEFLLEEISIVYIYEE